MSGWGPAIFCPFCAMPMAWSPSLRYWRHVETGTPADEGCEHYAPEGHYKLVSPDEQIGRDYTPGGDP